MMIQRAAPPGPGTDAPSPEEEDGPAWVPVAARNYLAHTGGGQSIRTIAREERVSPSTILRRVRRVESLRDDPLVDAALRKLTAERAADPPAKPPPRAAEERAALGREAVPVLRRLAEAATILAVAREMDRGVVLREAPDGGPQRLAVVERRLAEAMALRDWIACDAPDARVARYRITPRGRAMLKRELAGQRPPGLAEAPAPFVPLQETAEDERLSHMRSVMPESPVAGLARRRDGEGQPFLDRDLVAAGDRLREDFEVAQRAPGLPTDWQAVLAGGGGEPRSVAEARVRRALADLGPGLAEVALGCCCLLEGLETVEKRMGWSQRSGKVVLRIALQRLQVHYAGDWTAPRLG